MGRIPAAIFIGRIAPDTGINEYRRLAKKLKLELTEYTHTPNAARFLPKYDVAFVSRYLAILEALAAGIPVVAHYNNAIKYDYLNMAPFAKFIKIFQDPKDADLKFDPKIVKQGQFWARKQTWDKLAATYEKLWQE